MSSRLGYPPVSLDDSRPSLNYKLSDNLAASAGLARQLQALHLNSTATEDSRI